MGLIQNKVTVSQPNSHVVVKNAGGLRGLTGETGPQGPQGVPGEAATVTAGTTTTLPAGSDATVQNVGSTSAAIFNFGIPKGDKGDTGESGAAATISVGSTSTLPAGSSATVTNSGTSSAAVFDFGIPKGDKGDTGATGADGYSPSATVTKTGDTATITITDKDGTTTASISDGTTPTVNDGTLTIQKNGTTVQTFSADQASNVTANITVPTQFSELSGTVSSSQIEDEAITTGSVSGTGTNITLAGTMEGGAIESVELNGDTEQTTYSGKNKAKFNSSYTANGITTTLNDDGSLTCSGTTTTTYFNTLPYQETLPSMLPAGTYTFSRGGDTTYAVQIQLWDSTKNQTLTFRIPAGQTKITDTTTFDAYYYGSSFVYLSANMQINTTVKLQLESGSSATSFEPYVGGTASPNPDYPQEVQTVTGEQTVTVVGKNLLDESTMEQGSFNYLNNQESAHTGIIRMSSFISCQPNTTYAVSSNTIIGEFAVVYKDINGNIVEGQGFSVETQTYTTFTTKSNATEMRIRIGKGAYPHTAGVDYKLQLELGNQPTSYAPYKGVTKTVNLGKNLYEGSPSFDSFSSISGWEDGGTYNGMPVVKRAGSWIGTYRLVNIEAGKTYTFSLWIKSDEARQVSLYALGGSTGATATISPESKTITTSTNWERVSFTFACTTSGTVGLRTENMTSSTTNYTYISGYQLELGSTATTYAPYFTPIELCKIGTYQDYIYKSGEDWYVHKETGKVIFTGAETETWSSATAATGYVRFSTASGETHADNNGYCNELINRGSQSHGAYEYVWVQPNANAFFIQVLNTRANGLSSFRTWLSTHPATIYYDIAATDTQITNAALISELEDLLSATTYSGTTYITVSGDLASPLEVVAEADSKLAPDSVYGAAIKDGAVSVDKIADLKALADALAPYLNS